MVKEKKWLFFCMGIFISVLCIAVLFKKEDGKVSMDRKNREWTSEDFLKVDGTVLKNKKGDTVMLKGVNLGGWLIQESWMCPIIGEDREWANLDTLKILERRFSEEQVQKLVEIYQDNWITEWDIENIASTGCNVVRVPFWYRNFMKNADGEWLAKNFDENPGARRLDWVIETAGKYGMYVILDMHGCPGGQSMDHCSGTLARNDLYTNETYQQVMENLWCKIAERYKDNPIVAAYDIMNEPQNNDGYEGEHSYDPWNSISWEMSNQIYDRMIQAIRKVDPNHAITVEGIWRVSNLPNPEKMGWTNMIYQTHLYDDDNGFKTWTQAMFQTMKDYQVAGYIGEFQNLNGLELCNQYQINWTTWTYKGTTLLDTFFWYYSIKSEDADVRNDSYEEIKEKWGEVIQTKNFSSDSNVIDVIKKYAKQK